MIERIRQWLLPGLGVKRWMIVNLCGIALAFAGVVFWISPPDWLRAISSTLFAVALGTLCIVIGLGISVWGVRRMAVALAKVLLPDTKVNLRELLYQRRQKGRGPKIVVIGGGSGLSTLLRGLKDYSLHLTAVVTVGDDGGSSGRLREELGVLPPGDIRNCLVALSDAETLLTDLFNYRFQLGNGLAGHNFGNLFLAAMTAVKDGNFIEAIRASSRVLNVRGRVLPSTLENVTLVAEFADGEILRGESRIGRTARRIAKLKLDPEEPEALPEVLSAIHEADAVILGPGSLYTSIIPNLRVKGVVEALQHSPALMIYVCNIMTQPGETTGLSAADHLEALVAHSVSNLIDYMLVNTGEINLDQMPSYREEGGRPVEVDWERLEAIGFKVLSGDFVASNELVRHDSEVLAKELIDLIVRERFTLERRRALIEHLRRIDM